MIPSDTDLGAIVWAWATSDYSPHRLRLKGYRPDGTAEVQFVAGVISNQGELAREIWANGFPHDLSELYLTASDAYRARAAEYLKRAAELEGKA